MIRSFPHSVQKTGYTCGAATAANVVTYMTEYKVTEEEAQKEVKATPKDGLSIGSLAKYLRSFGLIVKVSYGTFLSKVCREVKKNRPVIVCYQNQKDDNKLGWKDGHWGVIIGCTSTHVILSESSDRRHHYLMSKDKFNKRWYDYNLKQRRYRVAIFVR